MVIPAALFIVVRDAEMLKVPKFLQLGINVVAITIYLKGDIRDCDVPWI